MIRIITTQILALHVCCLVLQTLQLMSDRRYGLHQLDQYLNNNLDIKFFSHL